MKNKIVFGGLIIVIILIVYKLVFPLTYTVFIEIPGKVHKPSDLPPVGCMKCYGVKKVKSCEQYNENYLECKESCYGFGFNPCY